MARCEGSLGYSLHKLWAAWAAPPALVNLIFHAISLSATPEMALGREKIDSLGKVWRGLRACRSHDKGVLMLGRR